ncbi:MULTISPECIES: type II toxin-antitoxin system death-on-curing family toxin [Caballeronia]|uniref:Type II toxin-antitoxin system death-on-curing family toxin n=1 Tax=Caballeronia jiangsuensis TaxID=1458357 RepID=A0ABW9CLQ9_9BURK|nr:MULTISPECIES: type II toxin-antitoxin system death-on-curing family toxin [Caballeronia]GJH08662.1 type II toxin-antitoxin system death-on-curing family toxin [Caballeronia novacaledonica]
MLLNARYVIAVHDDILDLEGGLPGFAQAGPGGVEAVLARVENHAHYAGLDDIFGIAAMYAVAIARGHVFNDGNKRTALVCALTYLSVQGYDLSSTLEIEDDLVEVMVEVAEGKIEREELADYLSVICMCS